MSIDPRQCRKPAKRAFTGLAGSPLATTKRGPGRPPKVEVAGTLRLKYSLSTRQLAGFLDDKDFSAKFQVNDYEFGQTNRKFRRWFREIEDGDGKSVYRDGLLVRPGTMEEWRTMLPLKWVSTLIDAEKSFYKDYANRNLSQEQMQEKYGEVLDEQIQKLEDRIVRRALYCRLINVEAGIRSTDYERDREEGWALENRAIAQGVSYVGGIYGSNEPGARGLRNFKTPRNKFDSGGFRQYAPGSGGPTDYSRATRSAEDDYGEESGS